MWVSVMWPGEIVHGRGTWTHSRTLCIHLQASGRAGLTKRDDVEKGAVVTWKILYSGDREEKGTRTTTPNHADKTQLVQQSRAGCPCRRNGLPGQQHLDPAGVALGCHSQSALPGGSLH